MSLAGTYTETPAIFLQPRPLARTPGRLVLLPLLPRPRPVKPLPAEIWSKVLSYVIDDGADCRIGVPEKRARLRTKWELLFVCKPWVVSIVSSYAQQNRRVANGVCDFLLLVYHVFDFANRLIPLECRSSSALFQSPYLLCEHASKVRRSPVLL
jgi:hypothetical protein